MHSEKINVYTSKFDEGILGLTDRRGKVYGHPYDDFEIAAKIAEAVSQCPDPRLRHVLRMIGVKMARLVNTPGHFDSWLDIAGYARTACMVMDRETGLQVVEGTQPVVEETFVGRRG